MAIVVARIHHVPRRRRRCCYCWIWLFTLLVVVGHCLSSLSTALAQQQLLRYNSRRAGRSSSTPRSTTATTATSLCQPNQRPCRSVPRPHDRLQLREQEQQQHDEDEDGYDTEALLLRQQGPEQQQQRHRKLQQQQQQNSDNNRDILNTTTGTKRLLAVRVSTTFGEEPEESLASIQEALFGTGGNGTIMSSSDGSFGVDFGGGMDDDTRGTTSVVAQYAAVSHGQLLYIAAAPAGDGSDSSSGGGVLDITIDTRIAGADIQDMMDAIVQRTEQAVGGSSGAVSLADVADTVIFCLPTGGLFAGDGNWTAFTFVLDPVRHGSCFTANRTSTRCSRFIINSHALVPFLL
jgi:hypothetical protein